MNLFKNFDWSAKSIAKAAGVILIGFVALALAVSLISFSIRTIFQPYSDGYDYGGMGGGGYAEMAYDKSMTNQLGIIPPEPGPDGEFVDTDAESFEVRDYSVNYQPNSKDKICSTVSALKTDAEIIFENASESDRSCNYRFKVLRAREAEILALLAELDPEDINNNVYTIQRTIQDNESRVEILKKQLAEKEAALNEAQSSYTELQQLATRKQDIENLTKLIDLKINTIDRLAQERIQINQQLDQMASEQARQLERLKYTTFSVSVYEDRIVDFEQIVESWKIELKIFVQTINEVIQAVSITLATYALRAVEALIYLLLAVIFLRVVWALGRRVWYFKRD
jgi:hypothetical protein